MSAVLDRPAGACGAGEPAGVPDDADAGDDGAPVGCPEDPEP